RLDRVVEIFDELQARLETDLGTTVAPATQRLREELVPPSWRAGPRPHAAPHLPFAVRRLAREQLAELPDSGSRVDSRVQVLTAGPAAPPLVVISGELGTGKSTLAAHACLRAADAGATVLWGAAFAGEGSPPYGAFAEAL